MKRAIGNMRTTTAWAAAAALAATLALAGCVTARIDYPLGGVAQARPARFQKRAAVFVLRDARYADKRSVATFANRKGTYNTGIAFSPGLADFAAVFGGAGTTPDELWYVAPDRLYWKPGGPFDDLRDRLAEHLRRAGVFASLVVADGGRSAPAPGANATGAGAVPGAPLRREVTLKRFISLKRRPMKRLME